MERRTRLEYEATAMLLDMIYDPTIHCYCIIPMDPTIKCSYFDADTYAEIELDEVTSRGNAIFHLGVVS